MALQFFTNDFFTIDIGFRYTKIVQVRKKKNNDITIINYGIGDTPQGCIKNGAISDKNKVIDEIKRVINENKLAAKDAKVVISGTNIITRIIMIDRVPESEMDKKIWDEIYSYLPINLDEHRVDYKILDFVKEDGKDKIKVFVTAVAKKIIDSYIDILKGLNLKPIAVDIPANSVSKFFQKDIVIKESDNWLRKQKFSKLISNTVAVIDLGSETTIINILKNKIPEFNRVLLMGSSNIDSAIFNVVGLEKNQLDKAERYKKMYGMVKYQDSNNELQWLCSEATKTVLIDIVKNINMCFEFYISRCVGEQISKIYLSGGGSQLKGIRDYFEETFNIPTYPINLTEIHGIEFSSELDTDKINYLVNALGIAL